MASPGKNHTREFVLRGCGQAATGGVAQILLEPTPRVTAAASYPRPGRRLTHVRYNYPHGKQALKNVQEHLGYAITLAPCSHVIEGTAGGFADAIDEAL